MTRPSLPDPVAYRIKWVTIGGGWEWVKVYHPLEEFKNEPLHTDAQMHAYADAVSAADNADARRTAEYWKAEHLAGNERIKVLEDALRLLGVMFDAYEDGPSCYEVPEELAGFLGNAIKLGNDDFHAIADLLNTHLPRVALEKP